MWTFMKENKSEWGKCGPKSLGRGKRTFRHLEGLSRHTLDNRDEAGQGCCHEFRWDYGSRLSTATLFLNVHVSPESLAVGLVHNSFMFYIASLLPSLSASLSSPPFTVPPVACNVSDLALCGALPKHRSWPVAAPVSFLSVFYLPWLSYLFLLISLGPGLWHSLLMTLY